VVSNVPWALAALKDLAAETNRPDCMDAVRVIETALAEACVTPVLDSPVHIENTLFSTGVKWSIVIACLQRQYEHRGLPRITEDQRRAVERLIVGPIQ
jgi:hypothetical protein